MPVGHARSVGISILVALGVCIGLAVAVDAAGPGTPPLGGAATTSYDMLGRSSQHRYIGRHLPPLPVSTQQAGPDPDTNLTVTAVASQEHQPNGVPTPTLNRVAFSSDGVDMDRDGRIDLTPPDPLLYPDYQIDYDIWIMRPDGSEQILITYTPGFPTAGQPGNQIQPSYDPGGPLIAFAGDQSGRWEIYTIEVSTGVVSCLTSEQEGNKMHPTWSPDGNWIAYQCDAQGSWDIYKLPSTGAAVQTRLTMSPGDETDPAWVPTGNPISPGGNAIAYTGKVGPASRVEWVDAITGDVDALTEGGGDGLANDKDPAWSRDGMYLAFASDRFTEGDMTRDFNIYRMSAVGEIIGPEAFLVSNLDPTDTTDDIDPSWSSPSLREPIRIYYESQRADAAGTEPDIWGTLFRDTQPPYLVDLPSLDQRQLAPGDDAVFHAPVYDADSGVARVFIQIKDPDQKIWVTRWWMPNQAWDSGFEGEQYLEWDYRTIASLEIFDDGDPANGDAVIADGIFSGTWPIPLSLSSDLVIDVFVIDEMGNSQNYDSVYGFSTEVFSPVGNVLLVNDYCEGQHFIYERGFNNDFGSAWYCESFYTENPGYSPASNGNEDLDSIRGYAQSWGTDEPYRIWRVICRGPVPPSVYQYYLPTLEYQLDPVEAVNDPEGAAPTRQVRVAERAIIWAAPHTGNVWVADGSLVDAGTQADLGFFLDRGGRLFVSGSDIAWALTLAGTVPNSFLGGYLRASYVRDVNQAMGWSFRGIGYGPNWSRSQRVNWDFKMAGIGNDPVSFDPWVGTGSPYTHWTLLAFGVYDADDMPTYLTTPDLTNNTNTSHADAHQYSWRPDVIQPIGADTVNLYVYDNNNNGSQDAGEPTAGLRYENTATSAKVIYLAFGFESIHKGYHTPSNLPPHCKNHRSHLIHNSLCWMRTGGFQGRVIDIAGGKPITDPNPVVRIYRGIHEVGAPGTPDFAVRCQDDGTFMIAGVPPAFYSMEAFRMGYDIDHFDGYVVHGGWEPFVVDFAMVRSRPGVVAGVVRSEATNAFLPLVNVKVWAVPPPPEEPDTSDVDGAQAAQEPDWDELGDPLDETLTAVDGSYKLEDLPPGDYYVRADGTTSGYGTAWALVTVTAGNTTIQNFLLPAADGTLFAAVTDTDTGAALGNALVEARTQAGVIVGSGTTADDGTVTIGLQPGTYSVTAGAAGYETSVPVGAVIHSTQQKDVAFTLQTQPPGSITGQIVAATSGSPVGGVLVRMLSNDVVIGTTVSAAAFTTPGDGGPDYNYQFVDVPTGNIVVQPAPVGFTATPAERTVAVVSGMVSPNVNFSLTSLHTFPAGLQLVSAPYDYSDTDPMQLLGIPPTGSLMMATWEGSTQRYRMYPQAPADRFRIGTGYWLRMASVADVTLQGLDAVDPTPIVVNDGWNLIGNPFPVLIDFFTTQVESRTGLRYSMQEALAAGVVEGGMFAYVLGGYQNTAVFSPWVGTWLKANEPITLYVSKAAGALSADAPRKPCVAEPEDGWLVTLATTVGGLRDTSTHFGAATWATDGYDKGLDVSKPPAADFGPCIYAAFDNDCWTSHRGSYSVDIRSSGKREPAWPLKVWTNLAGAPVTISWPDLSRVPNDLKPVLRDLVSGRSVYMRTNSSYTFTADEQARNFEITLVGAGASSLTLSGVSAQQATSGSCQVAYTLSADAAVSVEILNIAGRPVRTVCASKPQSAGTNTALWDGRSETGTRAPAGRYLVRVQARGADGQQSQSVTALRLTR